jgi:hypothetical protein
MSAQCSGEGVKMPAMQKYRSSFAAAILAVLSIGSAAAQGQSEHEHPHNFSRDVDAFHSVLAPLWHAPAGKERSQRVCEQAPRLEGLAAEIRHAEAPALVKAVAALKSQCQTNPVEVDAALAHVHDAFHHLAEKSPRRPR